MTSRPVIVMAHILGAHGIKGDVALKIYAEEPKSLLRFSFPCGKITTLKKGAKDIWIGHFEGVDTREAAERIGKAELTIPRDALPKTGNDEYYLADLIGLRVLEGDTPVGRVTGTPDFGAGILLDIAFDTGRSVFLPFQSPYVGEINLENGTIRVENAGAFL